MYWTPFRDTLDRTEDTHASCLNHQQVLHTLRRRIAADLNSRTRTGATVLDPTWAQLDLIPINSAKHKPQAASRTSGSSKLREINAIRFPKACTTPNA